MRRAAGILIGLVAGPGLAHANTVCPSNGWQSTAPSAAVPEIPAGCPLELYLPATDDVRGLTASVDGAAVAVTTNVLATVAQPRVMNQCSTVDASCWQWNTFDFALKVVEVVPASPFPAGATVRIGDGTFERVAVRIGEAGACPSRRAIVSEMCADPLGGPCTGGAFTCASDDGGSDDGDAACDAGVDHGAADRDGGGCAAGGAGGGLVAVAAMLLGLRRRRR